MSPQTDNPELRYVPITTALEQIKADLDEFILRGTTPDEIHIYVRNYRLADRATGRRHTH